MSIKSLIRTIPDFPKAGIQFRDITTLLKDTDGFHETIEHFANYYQGHTIDKVLGIESRGFILGAALAYALGKGFVPVRKRGKLPGATKGREYELEYGTDRLEIHTDAINAGEQILLVDDLIATGGTAEAAGALIEDLGGKIVECAFVIELPDLGGRKRLEDLGYRVYSLCEFEGE